MGQLHGPLRNEAVHHYDYVQEYVKASKTLTKAVVVDVHALVDTAGLQSSIVNPPLLDLPGLDP